MELATLLTLLQAVPGIFAAAQSIRADLTITDQATLDKALADAKSGALAAVAQADADLAAAGRT
jgi:hypothetical protein